MEAPEVGRNNLRRLKCTTGELRLARNENPFDKLLKKAWVALKTRSLRANYAGRSRMPA